MYDQFNETINPFTSGCQVICSSEDEKRHERVGQCIHWKICQHYKATHKRTGMNTNHNLLSKQIMPLSYGTLQYTLIEKFMLITQILQLKITKTTQVYWLSWYYLRIKNFPAGEFGKIFKI